VTLVCALWMWMAVNAVVSFGTGCYGNGWDDFSWRCWDFSIAYTYIWLAVAGVLGISATLSALGSRAGRVALLLSAAVFVGRLIYQRLIWRSRDQGLLEYFSTDGGIHAYQMVTWCAFVALTAWALFGKKAREFYASIARKWVRAHACEWRR
jgi:hypothetical protein